MAITALITNNEEKGRCNLVTFIITAAPYSRSRLGMNNNFLNPHNYSPSQRLRYCGDKVKNIFKGQCGKLLKHPRRTNRLYMYMQCICSLSCILYVAKNLSHIDPTHMLKLGSDPLTPPGNALYCHTYTILTPDAPRR